MKPIHTAFVLAASLGLSTTASADDVSIQQLAPEGTFAVVSIDNIAELTETWNGMPLSKILTEGPLAEMMKQGGMSLEQMHEQAAEQLEAIGIDLEQFPRLAGSAGMAYFMATDEETGAATPGMLICMEFGVDAEKFSDLFAKLIEEGEANDAFTYETSEVAEHTVYSLVLPEVPDEMIEGLQGIDAGGMPIPVMPDPNALFDVMRTMHIVQVGGAALLCNSLDSLTDAVDLIGENGSTDFAQREDVQNALAQIGDADARVVTLVDPLMQALGRQQPMLLMMRPMLNQLVGDIRAISAGFKLDGAGAVDLTYAVSMPNGKSGLSALMDTNGPISDPPSFVSPETIMYGESRIKFGGLLGLIRPIILGNPLLGQEGGEMFEQLDMMFTPMLEALGDRMINTAGADPNSGALNQLYALSCTDEQAFENAFGGVAQQMGMAPRDFLGHRIYTLDPAMLGLPIMGAEQMLPTALGIGGGYVFFGTDTAVEQALRSSADEGAATLADEPMFKRASAVINSSQAGAWAYMDFVSLYEAGLRTQLASQAAMVEQMRAFDPEFADEMAAGMLAMSETIDSMDLPRLRRFLGPIAMIMKSTEDGYIGRLHLLAGDDAE